MRSTPPPTRSTNAPVAVKTTASGSSVLAARQLGGVDAFGTA
jgi:hypothetical protein